MKKKYLIIGIVIALGLSLFGFYRYIEIKKDEERQIAEAEEQKEKFYDSLYDKYNTVLYMQSIRYLRKLRQRIMKKCYPLKRKFKISLCLRMK